MDKINDTALSSEHLADEIIKILLEKQGIDVKKYDVREAQAITDFYINVTGRSLSHVASLSEDICDLIELQGKSPARVEGKRGNSWILIDYLDVIVNVFNKESREFYNFERLLPKESLCDIVDLITEVDKKYDIN